MLLTYAGFQDRCFQPLSHLSMPRIVLTIFYIVNTRAFECLKYRRQCDFQELLVKATQLMLLTIFHIET